MLEQYPEILTTKQVGDILQISSKTVYKLINNKELVARKIASHYRISKESIVRYLQKD